MNITVTNKIKNDLLSREEIEATINFDGPTPSRQKVLKELSESIKAKPDTVIVKQILTEYGKSFAKVIAYVYTNKETMEKLERKNLIEKHAVKAEPKKEEAATEAPKEEAKPEEPKAEEEKKEDNSTPTAEKPPADKASDAPEADKKEADK